MTLDWTNFTPASALIGGAVIGAAAALYVLGNGRVAGIAGIVASPWRALRARTPMAPERTRLWFLAGLLAAPWAWRAVAPWPQSTADVGLPAMALAGLLVGFGVRMGGGCTSGHGVCGLARRSGRSLANVLAFMASGAATVFVLRHLV